MAKQRNEPAVLTPFQQLIEQSRQEYEQVQQQLKEIDMLIQQTSGEVDRLSQRNAQATNRAKQLEARFDTAPRPEIQETFAALQDAQKRLFMMRGQLEKLQSDQQNYQRYGTHLKSFLEVAASTPVPRTTKDAGPDTINQTATVARIIEAQEQERQRLVRQLHDGPAQSLTNLILQAEICERLFDNDTVRARGELANLKSAVSSTFQKVRDFMFDLRPMMLDDLGLIPTLKRYVSTFQEKNGIATNLTITGSEQRFAPYREVAIFRAIQEFLTNVRMHSHASHVQVTLDSAETIAHVAVEDNGSGFDPNEVFGPSAQRKTIGLPTQRERIEMLGGKLAIDSNPGRGTKVTVELPISEGEKA